MITPPFLSDKALIAVVAPSGRVVTEKTNLGLQLIENKGYRIQKGHHLFDHHFRFSGTTKERYSDLQAALDNPDIEAIFCARGGYGITKILDKLDFSRFLKHPKWIIGFSDITALLCHLYALDVMSIHGPMPNSFSTTDNEDIDRLFELLEGKTTSPLTFASELENTPGEIIGNLVGGNLSIVTHLLGTPSAPKFNDSILFLEDLNEEKYHIDRMIVQLHRSGVLDAVKGIILGTFSGIKDAQSDPFGSEVIEMIQELVPDKPIAGGFPAGHTSQNTPLVIGKKVSLSIDKYSSILTYC